MRGTSLRREQWLCDRQQRHGVCEGASVTVNGGSKHAGEWVVASGATLNITDGTFGDVQFTRNGTIAISGGTFKSIKSYIAEELQPLMSLLDTQKVHAFYKGDDVQDGNATELADVTVKEHTHTMVNNKCACGLSCTHTNTEGASTIGDRRQVHGLRDTVCGWHRRNLLYRCAVRAGCGS